MVFAAISVIMMIMAGALILLIDDSRPLDRAYGSDTLQTQYTLGDLTLDPDSRYGALDLEIVSPVAEISLDSKQFLRVCVPAETASHYTYFEWTVFSEYGTAYSTKSEMIAKHLEHCPICDGSMSYEEAASVGHAVQTDRPYITWRMYHAGNYRVKVDCYESREAAGVSEPAVYEGGFRLDGSLTNVCSWTYQGKAYELSVSYTLEDFEHYRYDGIERDVGCEDGVTNVINFVAEDDVTVQISDQLKALYHDAYDAEALTDGQGFADFVLAFVQSCFQYPSVCMNADCLLSIGDYVLYGERDYFAYPLETIFLGLGDCEDLAILAAAIFKSCGYRTAVVVVPNHVAVAVALDSYRTPYYNPASSEIMYSEIGGRLYFVGDAASSMLVPVGVMGFDANGDPYSGQIGYKCYKYFLV